MTKMGQKGLFTKPSIIGGIKIAEKSHMTNSFPGV
jgi:hypothetical protein